MSSNENSDMVLHVIQEKLKKRYYPISFEEIVDFTGLDEASVSKSLAYLLREDFIMHVQGQALEGYFLKNA